MLSFNECMVFFCVADHSAFRRTLQPEFLRIVKTHIENDNELDVCAEILSDLMVVLYGAEQVSHAFFSYWGGSVLIEGIVDGITVRAFFEAFFVSRQP